MKASRPCAGRRRLLKSNVSGRCPVTARQTPEEKPMSNPTRKVALVTGSARGIGLATAKRFIADGWRIALLDIDNETLNRTYNSLANSDRVIAIHCDVADAGAVARAVALVAEKFGRLDALVNNAAIAIFKPILEVTYDDWS